jgi:Glycosyl transferases group 1
MKKSGLNFLITPNFNTPADKRMVDGLAKGFEMIGHKACALSSPIASKALVKKCVDFSIDVVIQINRTRNIDVALPSNVRHISWYQDVFPQTLNSFAECFQDKDIFYALGDSEVIGVNIDLPCYMGSLVLGVDENIFNYCKQGSKDIVDFSLCGFIPPPIKSRKPFEVMVNTVEDIYQPLCGSLNINELELKIRENMAPYPNNFSIVKQFLIEQVARMKFLLKQRTINGFHFLSPFERSINFYTREYPRLLDRVYFIKQMLKVSSSIELYGPGWKYHPEFSPYFKGIIEIQEGLLNVFNRSRINLANNTHGLGLHSRTLECMAVGGFIFTHESPNDDKPGGMLTSFEPGVHYGSFTPENLCEEAQRWLKDDAKRNKAGLQAAEIVRQKHCWHHRAQQIIDDLNN